MPWVRWTKPSSSSEATRNGSPTGAASQISAGTRWYAIGLRVSVTGGS